MEKLLIALLYFLFIWTITADSWKYLQYYTNWSWILVVIYFSITLWSNKNQDLDGMQRYRHIYPYLAASARNKLCTFCEIDSIDTTVWMVDIIFWCLLKDKVLNQNSIERKALIITQHSANLGFILYDLKNNPIQLSKKHVSGPLILTLIYILFTWICVALGIWEYPYPFFEDYLDIANTSFFLLIISISVTLFMIIIFYGIVYGLFYYKNQLIQPSIDYLVVNELNEGLMQEDTDVN